MDVQQTKIFELTEFCLRWLKAPDATNARFIEGVLKILSEFLLAEMATTYEHVNKKTLKNFSQVMNSLVLITRQFKEVEHADVATTDQHKQS